MISDHYYMDRCESLAVEAGMQGEAPVYFTVL